MGPTASYYFYITESIQSTNYHHIDTTINTLPPYHHHSDKDQNRVVLEGGSSGESLSEFFGAEQEDHRVGLARLRAQMVTRQPQPLSHDKPVQ